MSIAIRRRTLPINAVCPVCKMAYRYKHSYLAHMERMHPDHSVETIDEGYQLAKDESLNVDMVENSAVISLDQAIQDLIMDTPAEGNTQPSSPKSQMIKCIKCEYTTRSTKYLNDHMTKKHGDKVFQCPQCPKKYSNKGQLTAHIKTHTNRYFCDQCGKELSSSRSLATHIKIVHEGKKRKPAEKKQCPHCPMMLGDGFESHVNRHKGVLPYICSICGKAFPGKMNLMCHEKTHEDKLYRCDECGRELSSQSHLLRHKKIHKKNR